MVILGDCVLLPGRGGFLDWALAAALTTAALEVFVGVQAHKKQPADLAVFQSLVGFELPVEAGQTLTQVLQGQPLGDVIEGVVAQRALESTQVLPAPPPGLLGQLPVAGNAQHHAQHQADQHRNGGNARKRTVAPAAAPPPLETQNLPAAVKELRQAVHGVESSSGSPRRSSSVLICESSSKPS